MTAKARHGVYDPDHVGTFGWDEVDAHAKIPQGDRPPSVVPCIAASTAEELLARFKRSEYAAAEVEPP